MKLLKAVLIDLSGTIHIDKDVIPGAIEALKKLRDSKKYQIKFVTNTTKESKSSLVNLLTNIGFDIKTSELFTSLSAARKFVDENKLRPMMLLADEALEDFDGVDVNDPNAVLIGLAPNKFDYEHMNKAFRLISNGAKLIAIHKARYYKRKDGLALGPGAFVSGLEYSCNVKAESLGKPNSQFFLSSIQEFNVKPEECVMIGDDALDDVQGAINAGMNGILVKTGKYRPNDESKISSPIYVADDFSQAVEFILKNH